MSIVIFDSEIAKAVGVNAAIIYEKIRYFCEDAHSKRDIYKYHDGAYWTYNSRSGWNNSLPFLTDEQIKLAIKKLKEAALIKIGNYNKSKWDKTNWFTILDNGKNIDWVPAPDPYGYKTQEPIYKEPINWVLKPNQLCCDNPTIPNESTNESTNKSYIIHAQSDKSDMSESDKFDFESIYKKYPKKEGKSRGFKILKVQIKTKEDYENIIKAIDNYSIYCSTNIKERKYIKHFSTFMGEWRDWINYEESKDIELTEEQLNKIYGIE